MEPGRYRLSIVRGVTRFNADRHGFSLSKARQDLF